SAAIVGRPNVGKSSLLNALLREPRALVDQTPGTTRDPVDSFLELQDGRVLRIVDTAGMRREVQIKDPIEYFGFLRSRRTLERVDAVFLVVDAGEGITGPDQRIASDVVDAGRGCVVVLNKWDLAPQDDLERKRFERAAGERLRFLPWAPFLRTAAKTGRGVSRLLPALESAVESHRRRLPTSVVNEIVRQAEAHRPHPRSGGRAAKVMYAVQAEVGPPRFVLFTSGPLETDYLRYLENRLRAAEPFRGTPVRFEVRVRPQKGRRPRRA
ncbi:MAG TPA: GTPase, partial [Actinomycetota bacterium]|nr:GTPase [Actinomycetota bacterium]